MAQVVSSVARPLSGPGSDANRVFQEKYEPYMSFSGADAVAVFNIPPIGNNGSTEDVGESLVFGELQTISYSIHRENSPVRTLGHVSPRGFIKGGRTIAGSMIFTVFNEYAFYKINRYRQMLSKQGNYFAPLADMLPPFDIVLSFMNEYGIASKLKIFGVTIVDEGQTVSIDDLITEQTYTYMARGIQPLITMQFDDPDSSVPAEVKARNISISKNIFGDTVVDDLAKLHARDMTDTRPSL